MPVQILKFVGAADANGNPGKRRFKRGGLTILPLIDKCLIYNDILKRALAATAIARVLGELR